MSYAALVAPGVAQPIHVLTDVPLPGDLTIPDRPRGLVILAHGSGSSRLSPRTQHVAARLQAGGMATLLLDLMTWAEEMEDLRTAHRRFDIPLLGRRLVDATDWAASQPELATLSIGLFGASTAAAAAMVAAAKRPGRARAVVSRGGRPDLAGPALLDVHAPALFIVGGADTPMLQANRGALVRLAHAPRQLVVVQGATHLFEEPGALDQVAALALDWFTRHLPRHDAGN